MAVADAATLKDAVPMSPMTTMMKTVNIGMKTITFGKLLMMKTIEEEGRGMASLPQGRLVLSSKQVEIEGSPTPHRPALAPYMPRESRSRGL